MIGQIVGHYRIEAEIGAGGMGVVYRAYDSKLRRTVAIKVLREVAVTDEDRSRRLRREARAASALNHPNIITIYDIDRAAGADFIVMEYVPGKSLRRAVPPGGLPIHQGVDYGVQIARAMAAAHAAGITHRDIKPENTLVTTEGQVKVLDFGLARVARPIAADASTRTTLSVTQDGGLFCGTLGYAAPEQVEGRGADARSDVFAIGAVLYEMLAGRPAFVGSAPAQTLAAVLHEAPPALRAVRREVPSDLDRVVFRCLEKDPDARYRSSVELLSDLVACQTRFAARRVRLRILLLRPAVVAAVLTVCLVLAALGTWLWLQQSQARWARTVALPEATRLIEQGKTYLAFGLLRQAQAYVPDDPVLKELLMESTTTVSIRTTPPGARVYIRYFFDQPDAWEFIGSTALEGLRVPLQSALVWKISLEGFQTREVLAVYTPMHYTLDLSLQPAAQAPTDMVHVPGGDHDFWIDKYEVTNGQFKDFVDRAGYERRDHWTERFVKDGKPVSWEEARQAFRDWTGRPGPAMWELGTYPDGQADYPVGGISWYEAAAYCASIGKQLPTVGDWYQAADFSQVTRVVQFSNFGADGPAEVGHPLRLGTHGTYDMAGNVKEWCWNEADAARRYILGGSWHEPSYQFHGSDAQPPLDRKAMFGVRCAKYRAPLPASQTGRIVKVFHDWRRETPVGDRVFAVYESLYEYDRTPLEPQVDPVRQQSEHWSVERLSFAAAYGNERVPARLLIPKNAVPPYQAVVYFPGGVGWFERSSPEEVGGGAYWSLFLVRSGRAVLVPVYKGMYERQVGSISLPHIWRDVTIQSAKDLRRAVDYLETRPDIDAQKLAYLGLSSGAALGPIMTAVERRFKASILLGGGLSSGGGPPESEAFHFLSRVKVPTLMVNGRHDFYFPWETSQDPMFRLLGTTSTDKRHRIFESGHVPTERQEVIKEVLDWLDRYLGPVHRQ
jgi:tRNA A-37 threonylcarbamoyl transferase component Bud32/dienelactone hydrolase